MDMDGVVKKDSVLVQMDNLAGLHFTMSMAVAHLLMEDIIMLQ